jgi:hypothetical protein
MRMPGKAGAVGIGFIIPEVIKQQERIELFRGAEPESAPQAHARAFHGRL